MARFFKFVSLRTKLIIVMLVALIIAASVFAGVRELGSFLVWRYYLDEEDRQERADGYVKDFQQYVTDNKLSVKEASKISSWDAGSYVDMIIYKDSTLFYAPDWFKDFNGDGEDDSSDSEQTETEGATSDNNGLQNGEAASGDFDSTEQFTDTTEASSVTEGSESDSAVTEVSSGEDVESGSAADSDETSSSTETSTSTETSVSSSG